MLRKETVKEELFELLTQLMKDPRLAGFNLVGGTALALYMGHRISIDIDLFSQTPFDADELKRHLETAYNFDTINESNATLLGYIDNIKVDFIYYPYPQAFPTNEENSIRIASMADIAAMKLTAISMDGDRLKDFVDIAFLSSQMSFNEMLAAWETKYPRTNKFVAIKALTFYDNIDFDIPVKLIGQPFRWKQIDKRLKEMLKYPDKRFAND